MRLILKRVSRLFTLHPRVHLLLHFPNYSCYRRLPFLFPWLHADTFLVLQLRSRARDRCRASQDSGRDCRNRNPMRMTMMMNQMTIRRTPAVCGKCNRLQIQVSVLSLGHMIRNVLLLLLRPRSSLSTTVSSHFTFGLLWSPPSNLRRSIGASLLPSAPGSAFPAASLVALSGVGVAVTI